MINNYINKVYASWLSESVKPDVYMVGTLKQSIINSIDNMSFRTKGTPNIYENVCNQFICRLSLAVYGKRNWRKFRKKIPHFATLEGNGYGLNPHFSLTKKSLSFIKETQAVGKLIRYHINICMRKPDFITFDAFQALSADIWQKSDWTLSDTYIEERTGDCSSYSLKEGPETLISLSF